MDRCLLKIIHFECDLLCTSLVQHFLEFMRILEEKSTVNCLFSMYLCIHQRLLKIVVRSQKWQYRILLQLDYFLCGLTKLSVSGLFVVVMRSRWLE